MKKTLAIALLFSYTALFAGPKEELLEKSWEALFTFGGSFLWVFAFLPFAVFMYAINAGYQKVQKTLEQESASRTGGRVAGIDIENIGVIIAYGVGSLLSVYMIYGTFVTVFAGGTFTDGWSYLVTTVWVDLFN